MTLHARRLLPMGFIFLLSSKFWYNSRIPHSDVLLHSLMFVLPIQEQFPLQYTTILTIMTPNPPFQPSAGIGKNCPITTEGKSNTCHQPYINSSRNNSHLFEWYSSMNSPHSHSQLPIQSAERSFGWYFQMHEAKSSPNTQWFYFISVLSTYSCFRKTYEGLENNW